MDTFRVMKLDIHAKLPQRHSHSSAGYDLCSLEATSIQPQSRALIPTGLVVAIPVGCYGRIAARSGIAVRDGIDVGAGVIDADYRGQLHVLLFNHGDKTFNINAGDRIAQLILETIRTPDVIEVTKMDETDRGQGGFGSTGK